MGARLCKRLTEEAGAFGVAAGGAAQDGPVLVEECEEVALNLKDSILHADDDLHTASVA
ncbi:hypothetical protein [Streptomyces sp. NPDC058385]|uniref:hypothetical protein n=1 Tax=Streptomyces sp. NPDC058385 TaxID=3346473 RepID=UPI00364A3380